MIPIKKLLRKICVNHLPASVRRTFIRSTLPEFHLDLQGIVFRPAVSFDDYIKAFRLLHDVYVDAGYIDPSPSALRIVPHHSHPDSRVFLGCCLKADGRRIPVYTISLFPDSDQGLPMDVTFKKELDGLRNQGRSIAEVGCLAANPLYKKGNMNIPMLGNRIIHQYASRCLNADDLVITVHPRFQWVYEDVLLFEKIKVVDRYPYVNGNPAVAMRLDLRRMEQSYKNHYHKMPCKKNLYRYFFCDRCPSILMLDIAKNSCLLNHLYNYENIVLNCFGSQDKGKQNDGTQYDLSKRVEARKTG